MIKTISFSILFFFTTFVGLAQEEIRASLTFEGLEEEVYYFSSEEDFTTFAFSKITESAREKYTWTDRKLIGRKFTLSYTTEEFVDEDNEPYEILTLIAIALIEEE